MGGAGSLFCSSRTSTATATTTSRSRCALVRSGEHGARQWAPRGLFLQGLNTAGPDARWLTCRSALLRLPSRQNEFWGIVVQPNKKVTVKQKDEEDVVTRITQARSRPHPPAAPPSARTGLLWREETVRPEAALA